MSRVLVDTSALYAVLDRDDVNHAEASTAWHRLLDGISSGTDEGVTHGSVLVESSALVQRRLGMRALRALHDEVCTVLTVRWVDAELHARAVAALLAADRREVSLVDWTSFELMRSSNIRHSFAFDDDFERQGFTRWR